MTRFIPKQFAENSTTSVVFGSHQEQGGHVGDGTISSDPATLQGGAAWPLGWKAATDNFFQIPRGEEMEGLERVLSAAIIQQFKDGLTFWQSEMPVTQYQTIVQYQTGSDLPKLYINITGTSTSTPPDSDTTNWKEMSFFSRNIGEIVTSSVPLTDAGLHLADGSLISGSGSYADFVTHMAGLVSTNPDLFETEANWQSSVSTYGVCGKYVYDSVNNTIRLPKLQGFIEGTLDPTKLGDLVQAGLPDINGTITQGLYCSSSSVGTGAFKSNLTSTAYSGHPASSGYVGGFDFSASRSSSIYGNSTTVQPQSIKVFYYVVIATSTKTAIEVDIDEIATDLNGKADADLSNLTNGLANTICTTPATTTSTASSAKPAVVVENYSDGTNWYRVWSDGWIEQGGRVQIAASAYKDITLLRPYSNADYMISFSHSLLGTSGQAESYALQASGSYFRLGNGCGNAQYFTWTACGY